MSDTNTNKQYRPYLETSVNSAVISDIKKRVSSGNTSYFASVGLIVGKRKDGKKEWQNVSLLISKGLNSFAEKVLNEEISLKDLGSVSLGIENLTFSAVENENDSAKPFLNNRGVLSSISKAVF